MKMQKFLEEASLRFLRFFRRPRAIPRQKPHSPKGVNILYYRYNRGERVKQFRSTPRHYG